MSAVNGQRRRVVITGTGCVTPLGVGTPVFWERLVAGQSGVAPLRAFDTTDYPVRIAAETKEDFRAGDWMDAREIDRVDRYGHYALAAAELAVREAALDPAHLDLDRAGVLIGSGIGGLWTIHNQHVVLHERGVRRISPMLIPMLIINMASGLAAMRYGFRGPNYCLASACATGTHAIGEGLQIIRRGDADLMLAGGSEAAITPLAFAGFCAMRKVLSKRNDAPAQASRPFDKDRDGFVMGEGAGVVVLEELQHALGRGARIRAELVGYAQTADAYHVTAPAPGGLGDAKAIQLALRDAAVAPHEVDYINAHGTSTDANDKSETAAIKHVFGDHAYRLAVSSNKSMIGHLLGAAGGVEAIATVKTLETGLIPPTINYETPDPECDLDYVPNQARQAPVRIALSNSMGFGGHNAVIVMRRWEPDAAA